MRCLIHMLPCIVARLCAFGTYGELSRLSSETIRRFAPCYSPGEYAQGRVVTKSGIVALHAFCVRVRHDKQCRTKNAERNGYKKKTGRSFFTCIFQACAGFLCDVLQWIKVSFVLFSKKRFLHGGRGRKPRRGGRSVFHLSRRADRTAR